MNLSRDDQHLERELRELPTIELSPAEQFERFAKIRKEVKSTKHTSRLQRLTIGGLSVAAVAVLAVGLLQNAGWLPSGMGTGGGLVPTEALTTPAKQSHLDRKVFADQDQMSATDQAKCEFLVRVAYAYENFQTLQGQMVSQDRRGNSTTLDFQIREGEHLASYKKWVNDDGTTVQEIFDGTFIWHKNSRGTDMIDPTMPFSDPNLPPRPISYQMEDGSTAYNAPADPARPGLADRITAPLTHLITMVDLNWSITGEETLLGRPTAVVKGTWEPHIGQKIGAKSYQLWFDKQTGLLLKHINYAEDGTVTDSMEVTRLTINGQLDDTLLSIPEDVKSRAAIPTK